jgi:galactokinase/mevalonate kinase-like predicted kinase
MQGVEMVELPPISERTAEVLKDILDMWLDGTEAATNDVVMDRTHESVEEMLEAFDGMTELHADVRSLREALREGLHRSPVRKEPA